MKGAVYFNFEKLTVYQKSLRFVEEIYVLTKKFPVDERFGLISQLKRASVSIPANIAEGSVKTKKDFKRYIDISKGSVCECVALLDLSVRIAYLEKEIFRKLKMELDELSRMLTGLKQSLTIKRRNSQNTDSLNT